MSREDLTCLTDMMFMQQLPSDLYAVRINHTDGPHSGDGS